MNYLRNVLKAYVYLLTQMLTEHLHHTGGDGQKNVKDLKKLAGPKKKSKVSENTEES
jgi:hypothetical protein